MKRAIIWSELDALQTRAAAQRLRWRQGLMVVAAAWVAGLGAWQAAEPLEREVTLPWLVARRGAAPAEAVILATDRASAQRLGLPPRSDQWPRHVYAELIRRAAAGGASVIAVDVFFAQARPSQGDAQLAAALADAGKVVLLGQMAPGAGLRRPFPPLAAAAAAVAPLALPPAAGPLAAVWLHHPAAPDLPTLPAAALRVQAGAVVCPAAATATPLQRAACQLTQGPQARLLDFYGPPRSLRSVPAAEVLLGQAPDLAGRAVFIGPLDPDAAPPSEGWPTAGGSARAPVEIAATAYLNALRNEFLTPAAPRALVAGLLLTALALAGALLPLRPLAAGALALTLVGAAGVALALAYARLHLWLPLAPWLAQIAVALLGALALRARDRALARATGGFRIDPLSAIAPGPRRRRGDASPRLPATRQQAVCLVSDASGFVALAERLPAGQLRELMNRYYASLLAPIKSHGGRVTDIVGDSAMALWPLEEAPRVQRLRACRAALDIQATLATFRLRGGGRLPTRIGLHVGEVMLGPVGALDHFEYRAIGDAVNTASRIEGLNKHLGTCILASAATVAGLTGLDTRRVGRFRLAGKAQAVEVYELRPPPSAAQHAAHGAFAAALAAFEVGDASAAARGFAAALASDPADPVAAFYLEFLRARGGALPAHGVIELPK